MPYDEDKWKAAQRAGYRVYERETHVGRAWDIGWPDKTTMEACMYKRRDGAIAAAVARYTGEVQRAEQIARWQAERWPWVHEPTGTLLHEHTFYAFGDDGVLRHAKGYATAAEAISLVTHELPTHEISGYHSEDPKDLGAVCACILTGRQYMDQLYELTAGVEADLALYGRWSAPAYASAAEVDQAITRCWSSRRSGGRRPHPVCWKATRRARKAGLR